MLSWSIKITIETSKRGPRWSKCGTACDTGKSGAGRSRSRSRTGTNTTGKATKYQTALTARASSSRADRQLVRISIAFPIERGNPIQHARLSLRPGTSSAGLGGCCGTTHRTDKTRNASHSLFSARVPALQHIASSEANSEGKTVPTTPLGPPGMEAEPAVERIMLHWGRSPDLFPCFRPSWLAVCAAGNGV
jgi:hypothetical protein